MNKETDYRRRISDVFKYIDDHLDADLSLKALSAIAFYSPYHFHRVFKFVTNEPLNEYVTRKRIEKAASDLIHRDDEISQVAIKYGFNDPSSFTRAFKKFYKQSPTEFKKQNPNKFSKISQLKSKNGQAYPDHKEYICIIKKLKKWTIMNANIEVKEIPTMNLAGVSHIGMTGVETAFDEIIRWATPQDLMTNPETKLGRVFYDSMKVTAPHKIRMHIFLKTDTTFNVGGEVTDLIIPGERCIVGRYEIQPQEFGKSWTGLFIWMNENGYKKSAGNPYEIYHNDYREHPENKFVVDLFIPIE